MRQQEILELARVVGRVEVTDLAERFEVTPETIRRDLGALSAQGQLHRVRGGAVLLSRLGYEPSLAERADAQSAEKKRIAQAALQELPDGGSVAFDAGSTVAQIVSILPDDVKITAITHAPGVISELSVRNDVTLHLVGGEIRTLTMAAVGDWAERAYGEVAIDVAFVGTNAISAQYGLNAPDLREAAVKRAMIASAKRVVAVADHTKIGRTDFGVICPIEDIDTFITDRGAEPELLEEIRSRGVTVRTV